MDEVRGVLADALEGSLGEVGLLGADFDVVAGDAPVAMTAGPALFVEVEIVLVAGVAGVSGPDLGSGTGVAREDGDRVRFFGVAAVGAIDEIGLVEAAGVEEFGREDGCAAD